MHSPDAAVHGDFLRGERALQLALQHRVRDERRLGIQGLQEERATQLNMQE